MNKTLTAIDGILVGHATDTQNRTGCTAILCPEGFTPGIAVPGIAPGSRETELMRPHSVVDAVHGIVLSGGSAFGLSAADGVMQFLQERGTGLSMPHGIVPIVPAAVVYDLDNNRKAGLLPDLSMGYVAAGNAHNGEVEQGPVGAGTGVMCGRLYAASGGSPSPSGLGSMLAEWRGAKVAALAVVNPLGDVYDPDSGELLSGGKGEDKACARRDELLDALDRPLPKTNTVLVVVATNVTLDKAATTRLAGMAAGGIARVIRPAHLVYDGDVVFALSSKKGGSEEPSRNENLLGALGAEAVAGAIVSAVRHAQSA